MINQNELNVATNAAIKKEATENKDSGLLSPQLHRELPNGSFTKKRPLQATASRNVETSTRCMAIINKK